MRDEPFHVTSQEWRYYSRQRAISNTLHLAQLPSGLLVPGVAVPVIQPKDIPKHHGQPPLEFPLPGGTNVTIFNTYNQFVSSTVYGCVGTTQAILAQRNCGIAINSWTNTLIQVTMTPNVAGKFLIHLECQTDLRTLGYQGPDSLGACVGSVIVDGVGTSSSNMQVLMQGASWDGNLYVEHVGHSSTTFIAPVAGSVVFQGTNLGDPAAAVPAHISCFVMKIDAP